MKVFDEAKSICEWKRKGKELSLADKLTFWCPEKSLGTNLPFSGEGEDSFTIGMSGPFFLSFEVQGKGIELKAATFQTTWWRSTFLPPGSMEFQCFKEHDRMTLVPLFPTDKVVMQVGERPGVPQNGFFFDLSPSNFYRITNIPDGGYLLKQVEYGKVGQLL